MRARITKLLLLSSGVLLSLSLAAQYPSNPAKSRLGYQTTGDGLIFRGAGAPAYSPGTLFNAWTYLDTTNMILYGYKNFSWVRLPSANNGLTMSGAYAQLGGSLNQNTTVESGTYNLKLGKTSGTNYAYMNTYGSGQYAGMYSVSGTNETDFGIGNGSYYLTSTNPTESHTFSFDQTGFDFTYIGDSGISRFRMDSTRFYMYGLPGFASHAAATTGIDLNGLYRLNDKRAIYINNGTANDLEMPFDSITFNPTTVDPDTAELKYSQDLETLVFGADGTTIEIGQKEAWYVKNQTGSTIAKGTVVRAAGTLGSSGRILVSPMVADGTVSSKYLLGITASSIANGADGYVIHFGKLRKTNTNSWNEGDVLYASATTPGALTNIEPAPPNLRLPIAFVVHKHTTNGVLAVRIQTGNELHELHDVDTSGINTGEGLVYNSTSNKWQASAGKLITAVDTAAMLSKYIERGDTAAMLSNYVDGAGTATRIPILTGTRTIGNSPALYNSTTKRWTWDSPSILELPMGTDAQRPSPATTSDFWYNMTGGGLEWYNGTRWAKALESTFNRGTATRVPYFDANGQLTESANLTYTGTRLQTGGTFRIGRANVADDTVSIEKVQDGNSRIFRINNPGSSGGWAGGFVFRGGVGNVLASVGTFRIYTSSSTVPGSTYFGNITESNAQEANPTTNVGVINKITTAGTYDTGININVGNSSLNPNAYTLSTSRQFGIYVGGSNSQTVGLPTAVNYGIFLGYQYQPIVNGYGSSMVLSSKNESGAMVEVLRLQGKDGNICLGCTDAQYQLYTTNTGAYGIPRGTVAQRPTIVTSTTPIRFNTDSTALEYGESVGTWRQLATRAYARSLISALPTTNIYTADGTLTGNRTLTGSSFWLNLNSNVGIKQAIPLQELDVNGDLRVRDSTDLDVTPAHSAITGLLTRDATGWVGAATLGGGLSYSAGVLSSSVSTGTVTSVGLSLPSIFSVSGSPVTTSGTLSATFTGGTNSLFLRGDGRWMKSLYLNSEDSVQFNIVDPILGGTALFSAKGTYGSFDSRWNYADYGYVNHTLAIATIDDARYNFDRSRGTVASPTILTKGDRVGGIYFRPHNGSSYRKAGYFGAVVDSVLGANISTKLIFGVSRTDAAEVSSAWRFLVEEFRNISNSDHIVKGNIGIGIASSITALETVPIKARLHVKGAGTTTGKTMLLQDLSGNDILTITDNKTIQAHGYGTQTKEAGDISKTVGNVAAFATDGTMLDYRITRDTSISNADFTVTSTLLSSCQELFISAEVTSSATDTVNVILPTPSATFKNNKVYVFGDDDSSTQWVAVKSANATGLYYSNGGVKPTATNYAAVTATTGVSGVTYVWICTRRNSGTWNWVLVRQ